MDAIATTAIAELQGLVREHRRVHVCGNGSKHVSPLSGYVALSTAALRGVIEYQPSEFVITVAAGTPVAEVNALLASHGQYLPFDPLFVESGATIGGTIAMNACGPERYRFGGARDFVIGVRFIEGNGELVRGGGKVVKNAAGFDYPKLFVGSCGRLGLIVELSFKVFPKPEAYASLRVSLPSLEDALALLPKLTNCPYDLNAVDLVIENHTRTTLWVRVGGIAEALPRRMDRVRALVGSGEVLSGPEEEHFWNNMREMRWMESGDVLVKVPLTPRWIPALDARIARWKRRYSVGGNVAWIATPSLAETDAVLTSLRLSGLVLRSQAPDPHIGYRPFNPFAERIKRALDPLNKFG